jgi:hypothetical protein
VSFAFQLRGTFGCLIRLGGLGRLFRLFGIFFGGRFAQDGNKGSGVCDDEAEAPASLLGVFNSAAASDMTKEGHGREGVVSVHRPNEKVIWKKSA